MKQMGVAACSLFKMHFGVKLDVGKHGHMGFLQVQLERNDIAAVPYGILHQL
jgi:hypothetical protein